MIHSKPGARVAWLGVGGHKQFWGAQKLCSLEFKSEDQKNMGLHHKICKKLVLALDFWGEDQTKKEKKIFTAEFATNRFLLTNSRVMFSILRVSGLKLHSNGTKMLLSLGHIPRLEGTILVWGGTSSDLGGHGPVMPLWRRAFFFF